VYPLAARVWRAAGAYQRGGGLSITEDMRVASIHRWILLASLLLLFGIVVAWTELHWAIETRSQHAPDPNSVVPCDGVSMSQESCLLNVLAPREEIGAVRHSLLRQRNLAPDEYVLFGLGGACVAIWLLLIQEAHRQPRDWDSVLVSTLLSGAAGFISYFLLLVPLSFVGRNSPRTMENWFALPLLAGTFNTVFYRSLPRVLTTLLVWIRAPLIKRPGLPVIVLALAAGATRLPAQSPPRNAPVTQQAAVDRGLWADKTYFRCHEPSGCICRATSEAKKATCPQCTDWEEVTLSKTLSAFIADIDSIEFRDSPGTFVFAASRAVFGSSSVRRGTASAMYADPSRFGYMGISAERAMPGSIVLYENTAGILVDSTSVLYPSTKLGGKLNIVHIDVIGVAAKVVIPKDVTPPLP
jgi:hypothetical protein